MAHTIHWALRLSQDSNCSSGSTIGPTCLIAPALRLWPAV